MTKTEQLILERIRAHNERGEGANDYAFIDRTKGRRLRFGYSSGGQKQPQLLALERLVRGGVVEKWRGLYYVKDHPALAVAAAEVNLPTLARQVEARRKELEVAEEIYARNEAFVRRFLST